MFRDLVGCVLHIAQNHVWRRVTFLIDTTEVKPVRLFEFDTGSLARLSGQAGGCETLNLRQSS